MHTDSSVSFNFCSKSIFFFIGSYKKEVLSILIAEAKVDDKPLPKSAGIVLCTQPANERPCYSVASSLIGWVHTQNDPWISDFEDFSSNI